VDLDQAVKILKVDLPISKQELKVQFRAQAHIHHPDKGGGAAGGICQSVGWGIAEAGAV
jgi:hypothetical protein